MGSLTFRVSVHDITLEALERVNFGRHAGNTWRGALGGALDSAIFRPRVASGPSGLRDRPRCFVLRAAALDGAELRAGERAQFAIHSFSDGCGEALLAAVEGASAAGVGPGRGRLVLREVEHSRVDIEIEAGDPCLGEVAVEFVTPTEFPGGGAEFGVLLRRVRDRVAALSAFYGGGAPEADYAAMGRRADLVETVSAELMPRATTRRSSRTGFSHSLSGFTGTVRYRGALAEFMPWLRAAEWTGVGRHTVWGNGQLRLL